MYSSGDLHVSVLPFALWSSSTEVIKISRLIGRLFLFQAVLFKLIFAKSMYYDHLIAFPFSFLNFLTVLRILAKNLSGKSRMCLG